jgi:hypothetical protein
MTRPNELSAETVEFLQRCGLRPAKILLCNLNTRLYHDLGWYGDIAESCMEELQAHYGVNLSGFDFASYFPAEFAGKNRFQQIAFWVLPFLGYLERRRSTFLPLTLARVESSLQSKKWI